MNAQNWYDAQATIALVIIGVVGFVAIATVVASVILERRKGSTAIRHFHCPRCTGDIAYGVVAEVYDPPCPHCGRPIADLVANVQKAIQGKGSFIERVIP